VTGRIDVDKALSFANTLGMGIVTQHGALPGPTDIWRVVPREGPMRDNFVEIVIDPSGACVIGNGLRGIGVKGPAMLVNPDQAEVYAFAIIEAADIARALNAQCWVAS
jgi:hypothetical protein